MDEMNKMLNAALDYADKGLAVFPLLFKDKKPLTRNGCKDATTDINQIREWWTKTPYANIGIATGSKSGNLFVIDIDIDDDKDVHGDDSLREWEKDNGVLPDTVYSITGRGGTHYLFRTDTQVNNRAGILPGVDIRGEGGYIVAPPSIHPNGKRYEWDAFGDIDEVEIAEADERILRLLHGSYPPVDFNVNAKDNYVPFVLPDVIAEGGRNDMLYRYAASLHGRGIPQDMIKSIVFDAAKQRCNPPLDPNDMKALEKSIEGLFKKAPGSVWKKDKKEKKELKPLQVFTGEELASMELEPPEFLVEGMVPVGVCILGAPPKAGKSWMVLDLALQIAKGGTFLGRKCCKSEVLYLALEDSLYRLQDRAIKVNGSKRLPKNLGLAIASEFIDPNDRERGLAWQITQYTEKHKNVRLVIVDTLQMVTPSKAKGEDAYSSTYKLLNAIRPLFTEKGIGFMLVHHTRKQSKDDVDPFETFLGSQALTGATDGMYIIKTKRGEEFSKFYARGRDFEDLELAIKRTDCRWESFGNWEDLEEKKIVEEALHNPIIETINFELDKLKFKDHKLLEYKCRPSDLMKAVEEHTGVTAATSPQNMTKILKTLEMPMFLAGIIHIAPDYQTTLKDMKGSIHTFRRK